MDNTIHIADYDAEWLEIFQKVKREIENALGKIEIEIEHVGSTSVPGLAAKRIIDLMGIVPNASVGAQTVGPLAALGYRYKGEYGIEGRFYFVKGVPPNIHFHMYPRAHPEIDRHLTFRDYLRAHPEAAREYAELKRALAEKYRHDLEGYTNDKTEFIRSTEAKARAH